MRSSAASSALACALVNWNESERAVHFPFESVISCLRADGKHFAPTEVLQALASLRARLAPAAAGDRDRLMLDQFLAVTLDKWDGTYAYRSYLGIDLLTLGLDGDGGTTDAAGSRRHRDEWVGLLLADLWSFEDGVRSESHDWLPQMRPESALLRKRAKLIETALTPIVRRLDGTGTGSSGSIAEVSHRLLADTSPERRLALLTSMQPVYTAHDEYLFIRILQSFELTFSAMASEMRAAISEVREKNPAAAAEHIHRCSALLAEARTLFSLVATMRAESFRVFRVYTEGASAIQSGNYKTFEALCSPPPRSGWTRRPSRRSGSCATASAGTGAISPPRSGTPPRAVCWTPVASLW